MMRRLNCGPAAWFFAFCAVLLAGRAGAQEAGEAGAGEGALADGLIATLDQAAAEYAALSDTFSVAWADGSLLRGTTLLMILAMTLAGSEILYWCYAAGALRAVEGANPSSPGVRVSVAAQRLLLRLFGIGIGSAAAYGALLLLTWPPVVQMVGPVAIVALASYRGVAALSEFVLSPRKQALRPWPMPDWQARRLDARVRIVASLAALGFLAGRVLDEIAGAPTLGSVVQGSIATLIAIVLLRVIGSWSRERRARGARRRRTLADLIPFGASFLVIACLALWIAGQPHVVETVIVAALLVIADLTAGLILRAVLRGPGSEAQGSIIAAYEPLLRRLIRFCLAIIAFMGVLAIWRIDVFMQASSDSPSARAVGQIVNVAVVILLCDLAWIGLKTLINRQVVASQTPEGETASRLSTLLPMIRTTVLIVLVGIVVLVTLSAMGVNIAPLLAGAGVVGLAIGFGAQTLVRDVITGVFFLIEDAFRVGEYIDVGTRKGTVEAISLRSVRLRHQRGALHTVPFGEIKSLSNESRDWSIVKLEFRIPFDTNLAVVKKIIKAISAEIGADPELGPNLLEPIKSQGINRLEEYWMVLRVKFTAKPNSHQFIIRREAYQRIRDAFEKAGIKLGERSVKVEMAGQAGLEASAGAAVLSQDGAPPPAKGSGAGAD